MKNTESIPARLKKARRMAGVTLEQLSQQTGYALTTLSGVENGHDRPSARLVARWIDALQLEKPWVENGTGKVFQDVPSPLEIVAADPNLAASLRSRIRKAREHADDLVRELKLLENDLLSPAKNESSRGTERSERRPHGR